MNTLHRIVLVALFALTACGVESLPPEASLSPAVESVSVSEAELKGIADPGDPTTPGTFTPASCQDVCTTSSRCDTACGGGGASCGSFGVCASCASACTTATPCGTACLNNGALAQCYTSGQACKPCSAATCEASGCGGMCMNVTQTTGVKSFCPFGSCRTYSRCDAFGATTGDRDSDGLPDTFESALAAAFFPTVRMGAASQHQFYGQVIDSWGYPTVCGNNPQCKVPFVARRVGPLGGSRAGWCADGQCIELSFSLPYNWDLGDGPVGTGSHRGDAEFVSVLLAYKRADDEADGTDWNSTMTWEIARTDPSVWRIVGRFYAAHLCADLGDSSEFRMSSTYVDPPGPMKVYVSNGKNGSYATPAACDEGAYYQDNCDGQVWIDRASVLNKLTNVGETFGGAVGTNSAGQPAYHGYVCQGFDTTIALPQYQWSTPTNTIDVWGTTNFDTSTSMYDLFRPYFLDWGRTHYSCW